MDNTGSMGALNWYGLMVTLGIVIGTWVAGRAARKKDVWDVLPWVVIPGVIGARLYHVIDWWWYYRDHLSLIPAVWTGGLGIYGGILGGVIGLLIYVGWVQFKNSGGKSLKALKKTDYTEIKDKFLEWLDVIAVGLPLGQAIGRWGNYFNQELYGKATDLPWAIYIKAENNYFHPLFAYEAIWNLLVFVIVSLRLPRFHSGQVRSGPAGRSGGVFALYLGLYGLGRFGLEWLRPESWPVNKVVSLSLVVLSWIWLWTRNRRNLSFS